MGLTDLDNRNQDLDKKLSNSNVVIKCLKKDNASLRVENRCLAPGAILDREAKLQYGDTIQRLVIDKSCLH